MFGDLEIDNSGLTLKQQIKLTQRTCKALGLSKAETTKAIDGATKGYRGVTLRAPKYVNQFVERFDAGRLPNLVIAKS